MEHRRVQVIPDPLVESLTLSFVNDQTLSFRNFKPIISSTKDEPSPAAGKGPVKIHHLEPSFVFEEPILRSLLSETSNIFHSLQQKTPIDVTRASMMYRSAIRSCLEALQAEGDRHQDLITVFYSVECIWHLFELLFLSKSAETLVVSHLLEWTYFHFPKSGSFALELMQLGREVDTEPNYWSALKDLVAKGKIDIARTLLQMHTFSGSTEFRFVDEILSKIQKPVIGTRNSSEHTEWQLRIQSGSLATEPELEEIAKLVTGDKAAWSKLCRTSECWYEYFPGYLYYTEPNCKAFKLPQYVNSWLGQWLSSQGQSDVATIARLNHLDRVVLGAIDSNVEQVLHDIQNMCDDKWFATHLTDLLVHFGNSDQTRSFHKMKDLKALRDSLVFDFGTNLMSRSTFWKFGVDYLEHCPEGPEARRLLLPRVPFKTEVEAFKLLSVAKRIKANESGICRILAQRNLANNRVGNALHWAIRAGDKVLIQGVVNIFLKHYVEHGELLCQDVLASIGSKMFISPSLVFLVKYYDFHEYYKERAYTQAADLLITLLDSKVTPTFFWPSLMADTIPLLEFKEPVVPSKETFNILHHVESNLIPYIEKRKADGETGGNAMNGNELVQIVRLACARNLSRCLVIENILGGP